LAAGFAVADIGVAAGTPARMTKRHGKSTGIAWTAGKGRVALAGRFPHKFIA